MESVTKNRQLENPAEAVVFHAQWFRPLLSVFEKSQGRNDGAATWAFEVVMRLEGPRDLGGGGLLLIWVLNQKIEGGLPPKWMVKIIMENSLFFNG